MKILVPGSNGQVGYELLHYGEQTGHKMMTASRTELDISHLPSVIAYVSEHKPDLIINAAAYTAVDKAEQDAEQAFAVNCDGAAHLAKVCTEQAIPLLHISTDYVFDGSQTRAYREDDPVAPLGVYGKSKWQGEQQVREHCPEHIILRTSWVFGRHGHNFVRTMLRLAQEREELRVVADQYGCPTYAGDIAQCLLKMAEQVTFRSGSVFGTYHYCGLPATSWHAFAEAIIATARTMTDLPVQRVVPIRTAEYPTAAKRPVHSVLNGDHLRAVFDIQAADWHSGLRKVLLAWLRPA